MANFQDILNKPMTEIDRPAPLPVGTYLCLVDGQGELAKIGKNNVDCINFKLKPVQAQNDVDQQALYEMLKGAGLSEKSIRFRLFLTEESAWRAKEFLENLGLPEGLSLREGFAQAPGKQVLVQIGHNASEDGKNVYMEVKGTAKV